MLLPKLRQQYPSRQDKLWDRTCFEVFLRPVGSVSYWEFNFSPYGDWNVYLLSGYRQDLRPETRVQDVQVLSADTNSAMVAGKAKFARPYSQPQIFHYSVDLSKVIELEKAFAGQGIEVGLTAIVQSSNASGATENTYWALVHAGDRPDFHRPESFVLCLSDMTLGERSEQ